MAKQAKTGFSIEAHNRSRSARAAIREGLESAYAQSPPGTPEEGYRRPERTVPMTEMERFLERLQDHQVGYHLVAGPDELVDLLATQLYARGGLKTLVDNRELVSRCRIIDGLRQRLIDPVIEPLTGALEAGEAQLGVTPCAGLIAETGTMVLAGTSQDELAASLVPPRHVIVAEESQLTATLSDWLSANPADGSHRVLLAGPSRTADIEKQVVIGVHGPWTVSLYILRNGWDRH